MKCFNCGNECEKYLCENCITEEILEKIFNEILGYKDELCINENLKAYAQNFENKYKIKLCIPEILSKFEPEVNEFYYCRYYKYIKDANFEVLAIKYLDNHNEMDTKKQKVIYDLLQFYLRNDFVKPLKWCEIIIKEDGLAIELYNIVAEFYSMIGEYELSEKIIDKAKKYLETGKVNFIFSNIENMTNSFDKLSNLLVRYKTKAPYWPTTEERRRLVAAIYDEKGIKHPRIEFMPEKISEDKFVPIKETYDFISEDYVAFWCSDFKGLKSLSSIYQIAAVKVRAGNIVEEFQEYIKPWDGLKAKEAIAKKLNIDISVLENAKDVDIVMNKFLNFIGYDTLISTEALGNQAKTLTRALRYSGISELKNGLFDLLDYAADVDMKFDLDNNNREFLLEYFKLEKENDSLDKARNNYKIYEKLKES